MRLLVAVLACSWIVLPAASLVAQQHGHDHASPYAAFTDRAIKALSAEEVEGLLSGAGLGMALAAELNGFPGPRHVLEMAPMLALSTDQAAAVRTVFDAMEAEARALGRDIVERERALDRDFAAGTVTDARLREQVDAIAVAHGRLRYAHLRAHLQVLPLLTADQRARYQRARGYAN